MVKLLVLLLRKIGRLQGLVGNKAINEEEQKETNKIKLETKSQDWPHQHVDENESGGRAHNLPRLAFLTTPYIK